MMRQELHQSMNIDESIAQLQYLLNQAANRSIAHSIHANPCKSTSAESHWWRIFGPKRRRRTESPCPFAEDQSLARSYLGYKQHPKIEAGNHFPSPLASWVTHGWTPNGIQRTINAKGQHHRGCHATKIHGGHHLGVAGALQGHKQVIKQAYLPKQRLFGSIPMVQIMFFSANLQNGLVWSFWLWIHPKYSTCTVTLSVAIKCGKRDEQDHI